MAGCISTAMYIKCTQPANNATTTLTLTYNIIYTFFTPQAILRLVTVYRHQSNKLN